MRTGPARSGPWRISRMTYGSLLSGRLAVVVLTRFVLVRSPAPRSENQSRDLEEHVGVGLDADESLPARAAAVGGHRNVARRMHGLVPSGGLPAEEESEVLLGAQVG